MCGLCQIESAHLRERIRASATENCCTNRTWTPLHIKNWFTETLLYHSGKKHWHIKVNSYIQERRRERTKENFE
jgi:hypothetical protein